MKIKEWNGLKKMIFRHFVNIFYVFIPRRVEVEGEANARDESLKFFVMIQSRKVSLAPHFSELNSSFMRKNLAKLHEIQMKIYKNWDRFILDVIADSDDYPKQWFKVLSGGFTLI